MKITEDVPKYAADQGLNEDDAVESGLRESAEFAGKGSELHAEVK